MPPSVPVGLSRSQCLQVDQPPQVLPSTGRFADVGGRRDHVQDMLLVELIPTEKLLAYSRSALF